jgi:queuine tRNA-ribosyltransferase
MTGAPIAVEVIARAGGARATTARTPRGEIRTPCFMPVGTRAAVKHLTADDLRALGVQVVLANTYHLMLRPGADAIASFGGLHRFMGFDGHVLTDSGGFQVFSLSPQVDDDGVTFRSVYDGSVHRLTPERAVAIQEALGADIQMALDVCPPLPSAPDVVRVAMERTAAWAARAAVAHRREGQALFGIVQGGIDEGLRRESARRATEIGFAGYGIGGLSVGETRDEMLPALAAATDELPSDRLRYLMGVGDPVSLVEAVAVGVDLFDCVLPSRLGRHGTVLTDEGRINLRNARFTLDDSPIDESGPSPVSAQYSRGYVRHLLSTDEPTGRRLLTLHNVGWLLRFVDRMRTSIVDGTFEAFRAAVRTTWAA